MYPPPPPGGKQGPGCLKIGLIVLAVLVVVGVGAFIVIALAAKGVVDEVDRQVGEAASEDYEVIDPTCDTGATGWIKGEGRIKNTSDTRRGFAVQMRVTEEETGDLIAEDTTYTDAIEPGQTQAWKIPTLKEAPDGEYDCVVNEVRYHLSD